MNINEENLYFVTPNIGLILKPIIIISIILLILISETKKDIRNNTKMEKCFEI